MIIIKGEMDTLRRNSKQRIKMRQLLCGRTDHPDAQTIYEEIRVFFPSISLGTVYRNLMLLTVENELQSINVGDGKVHFDPNIRPHAHFYCKKCHRVLDFNTAGEMNVMLEKQQQQFGGSIDECSISFKGTCADCMAEMALTE